MYYVLSNMDHNLKAGRLIGRGSFKTIGNNPKVTSVKGTKLVIRLSGCKTIHWLETALYA